METCEESRCAATVCVLILALHSAALGKIIYVDDDATGAGDGSSWANAYRFLQDALADANDSVKPVEIRVAQGVYKPAQGVGIEPGDKRATFRPVNGLTLRGGYAGLAHADPHIRDIGRYQTILSGDLAGDDVEVASPRDMETEPARRDNCATVVTCAGAENSMLLDGFTITGGQFPHWTVRDGVFWIGAAGLHNTGANLTVLRCTFVANFSGWSAGGLANVDHGLVVLDNCMFERNCGRLQGGGLYSAGGSVRATDCVFRRNVSIGQSGGGMRCTDDASVRLEGCSFVNNESDDVGGGVADEASDLALQNCVLSGNVADYGAGLWTANYATRVINCTFVGNKARCCSALAHAMLFNCIVWDNIDVPVETSEIPDRPRDAQQNLAFAGRINVDTGEASECPIVPAYYSCLQEGVGDDGPLQSNIYVDPQFVRPGFWADPGDPNAAADPHDPNAVWIDGDYHLKSQAGRWDPVSESWVQDDVTSPCIDAGDPNSPVGREPFPNGGRVNMGAYGGTVEAGKSYFGEPVCATIIAGDINGDCRVDFKDFQILATHWLERQGND